MNSQEQLYTKLPPQRQNYEYLTYLPALSELPSRSNGKNRERQENREYFQLTSDDLESLDHRSIRRERDIQDIYNTESLNETKKGRWSPEEDERLRRGIGRYGANKWKEVAEQVGTRSGDQCWKRWNDSLNPRLKHSQWTQTEDARLEDAVLRCGRMWSKIATDALPGRSGLACKNRWDHIQRKQRRIYQSEKNLQAEQEMDRRDREDSIANQLEYRLHSRYLSPFMHRSNAFQQRQAYPKLANRVFYNDSSKHYNVSPDMTQDEYSLAQYESSEDGQEDGEEELSQAGGSEDDDEGEDRDQEEEAEEEGGDDDDDDDIREHVINRQLLTREDFNTLHNHNQSSTTTSITTSFNNRVPTDQRALSIQRKSYQASFSSPFKDAKPLPFGQSLFSSLATSSPSPLTCNLPALKKDAALHQCSQESRKYPSSWFPTTSGQSSSLTMSSRQAFSHLNQAQDTQIPSAASGSRVLESRRFDYFADANRSNQIGQQYSRLSESNAPPTSLLFSSLTGNPVLENSSGCGGLQQIKKEVDDEFSQLQWDSFLQHNEQDEQVQAALLQTSSDYSDVSHRPSQWSMNDEQYLIEDDHSRHLLVQPFYPQVHRSSQEC